MTAVEAITSRYGQKDDEITSKINQQQLLTIQKTINAPFLQLVGFDKIIDKQAYVILKLKTLISLFITTTF